MSYAIYIKINYASCIKLYAQPGKKRSYTKSFKDKLCYTNNQVKKEVIQSRIKTNYIVHTNKSFFFTFCLISICNFLVMRDLTSFSQLLLPRSGLYYSAALFSTYFSVF